MGCSQGSEWVGGASDTRGEGEDQDVEETGQRVFGLWFCVAVAFRLLSVSCAGVVLAALALERFAVTNGWRWFFKRREGVRRSRAKNV